jgi:hypothetical protein
MCGIELFYPVEVNMWDEEQSGEPVDPELIEELHHRCEHLVRSRGRSVPINWGPGYKLTARVGPLYIRWLEDRGVQIDMFEPGADVSVRAYTQDKGVGGFINRHLVDTVVLPALRKAMILDDIADVGGAGA